ncbi:MAG: hypothetical protein AB8B51_16350 [Sedimentitalea sp.]
MVGSVTDIETSAGYDLVASFVYGDSQYFLVVNPAGVSYSDAASEAQLLGGALASLETQAENEAIFARISQWDSAWSSAGFSRDLGPWIGASWSGAGLEWESGAPVTYTNFASGEPNNYGGNEDYVHYLTKGFLSGRQSTWNDLQESGAWPLNSSVRVTGFVVETDTIVDVTPKTTDQIFAQHGQLAFMSQLALASYDLGHWETRGSKRNDFNPRAQEAFDGTTGALPDGTRFGALEDNLLLLSHHHIAEDLEERDLSVLSSRFPTSILEDGIYTNMNAAALVARSDDALFLSFRGTNDNATVNNGALTAVVGNTPDKSHWVVKGNHYFHFNPLIDAITDYVDNDLNGIEKIYVTGHSLGASMVEALTSAWGDTRVEATTFASPGYTPDFGGERRLTNFWLEGDPILKASWFGDNDGDKNTIYHNLDNPGVLDDETSLHSIKLYSDYMRFFQDHGLDQEDFRDFRGVDYDLIYANADVVNEARSFYKIGAGNDVISGRSITLQSSGATLDDYDDMMLGGDGIDVLRGRGGDDYLNGGKKADTLLGGSGDDFLQGGLGFDTMRGGTGKDVFIFETMQETNSHRTGFKTDLIRDFNGIGNKGDQIDLSAIDAKLGVAGDQAFRFIADRDFSGIKGQLRYEYGSSATTIEGDVNGDGLADFSFRLGGTPQLLSNDFIL